MDVHSVVNCRGDYHDIQIYHKSFPDFLLDPSRSKDFAVNTEDAHVSLFSHLILTSQHRDTILQILGQMVLAKSMPSDVDIFGTPANSLSPKRLTSIFGLEDGKIRSVIADIRLMIELGDEDQNIRIRHTSFLRFLLDRSRSRELFVDVNEARLTLCRASIVWLFNNNGM